MLTRHRYVFLLLAAVIAAAIAVTALNASSSDDSKYYKFDGQQKLGQLISAPDRKPAEDITGDLLDGAGTFSLAAQKGKVVLINFWATWCPPCVAETPQLDLVYRNVRSTGVAFLGVDTKNYPRSKAQSFVAVNKISYPMVYDEGGQIALKLGNIPASGLPFTVLVDKQGRVAAVYITPLTAKDISPVLNTLRGET